MSGKEHRPGVCEINLVVRHLKLAPGQHDVIDAAVNEIDQLLGLDGVSYDVSSSVLNLAYDATKIHIDNAKHTPWSCHNPPPGIGKRK